jgi:hypothetical protein
MTVRVLFIHHSTGGHLIQQGRAREHFRAFNPSIEFWDHGYDPTGWKKLFGIRAFSGQPSHGLRDGAGVLQPYTWHFPDHNTDPDGLAKLFRQPVTQPPSNALSHILTFDVIVFKSCYPVTAIASDTQLETYKDHYLTIRDTIDRYLDKLFIPMTPPPLRASLTTPEQAKRARQFANWMQSEAFVGARRNIDVYNFFDALAVPDNDSADANTLRPRYCLPDSNDSHPNPLANQEVAVGWVNFIVHAIAQVKPVAV